MRTLAIDIETWSEAPIAKTGAHRYAHDPSFEILLFAYSIDDGPVQVVDLAQGETLPRAVMDALTDPTVEKWAFNAAFERTCLGAWLGAELDPAQWRCSMVWALSLGLPGSLDGVGKALHLEQQKMDEGKRLIRYFCQPCPPTKVNGGRERNLPEHAPEKWATFVDYNRRDVEVELEIRRRLAPFPVPVDEWELYAVDQRINDRGVGVDVALAELAITADEQNRRAALDRSKQLTGLGNPNAIGQLGAWLAEQGAELPDLTKASVAEALSGELAPHVREVLQLRQELGKSSTKKYEAMVNCAGAEARAHGLLQFVGAGRTGRWAGRLIQVQNLPRNEISDLDQARALLASGELEGFELLYPVPDTLSQLIRTAFVPAAGHHFVVADYSAIEARVIAWLAGETWRLELFTDGGDIYCQSASKMFGVPVVKHGVNGELRQKGKIAELACIAEGQLVLTNRGLVPIEDVTIFDRVWDGVEFVAHHGLIERGTKDVIHYDGLTATPDHLVWVEGLPQPVRLDHAATSGARLIRSGDRWFPIRVGGGDLAGEAMVEDLEPLPGADEVHWVHLGAVAGPGQPAPGRVERLPELLAAGARVAEVVGTPTQRSETALYEPEEPPVLGVRGPRDRVQVPDPERRMRLDRGEPRTTGPIAGARPDRHGRTLRAGQPALRDAGAQPGEQAADRAAQLGRKPVALREVRGDAQALVWDEQGTDPRGSAHRGAGASEELAQHRSQARVFDLLNAGPRHRFTVAGRLVHNCGYGGSTGALINMGALQMGLEESELKPIVDAWREANPRIVNYWWSVDRATKHTVSTGEPVQLGHGVTTSRDKGILFITLPSGRRLAYPSARIAPGRFERPVVKYRGLNTANQWGWIDSYGPKFVENIVQATSRDLLAHALRVIENAGHRVVMHVHDEVVVEEPLEGASVDQIVALMTDRPAWAEALPLDADGYSCTYYQKD